MHSSWIVTIPKKIKWEDYKKELEAVRDGTVVMRYRVPFTTASWYEFKPGDRCYIVWNGRVRGWMEVTGVFRPLTPWVCGTTGKEWPAGAYLERSGKFHEVDGPEMKGFRGIRRYNVP